jgi:hypothetical protein
MQLYVYSDESGVFDKIHNDIFVFGGLIFLDKENKDIFARRYLKAERDIRNNKYEEGIELKACKISNKEKGKLYRSINKAIKFGVVIEQKEILDRIFSSKKDKQRYLDYAYKIGLKKALENLMFQGVIEIDKVSHIHIYCDEHTTATNGKYELREGLEQEFKSGTYNRNYNKFFPPLFDNLETLELLYCDSRKIHLIRAADIVANRIYFSQVSDVIVDISDVYITKLP